MATHAATASASRALERDSTYNRSRLFLVSALALVTAGVAASLRANTASDIQRIFFDPIDPAHSAEMIGAVLGIPFLGFALTIAIGSPLLDVIGMSLLLPLSAVCLAVGTLIMVFAGDISSGAGVYSTLWGGALLVGVGWGLVETVINPLTTSLYPEEKAARLNTLHAWWPGGLVIGGPARCGDDESRIFMAGKAGAGGRAGGRRRRLVRGRQVSTDRTQSSRDQRGTDVSRVVESALRGALHFDVSDRRVGTGRRPVGGSRAQPHGPHARDLLLVYVSGLMFVMRHFAGPLVHRLSAIGLLWFSCLGASLGLFALSVANSPVTGLLAATLWGVGVCYMWPTMLATASERFRAVVRC
jgi:MFS family permease